MEKFCGVAEEARKLMMEEGKIHFENLIFRRIREAFENGYSCIIHTYGTASDEHVDFGIVKSMVNKLINMGYEVEDIIDDETNKKLGVLKISW